MIDGPVIMTYTGRYVEPLNLRVEDILLEDVAHHLSNQCRFTGAVRKFYSVGEHSVRATRWLDLHGRDLDVLRWCLMHDAAEAYLVDIPRPLKTDPYFGKTYRGAEARAMAAVCERFELPTRMPAEVKVADTVMLATERRDLLPPNGKWAVLDKVQPLEKTIEPWTPERAERAFLASYDHLFGKDQ